jgi:hypothetical protein
MRAGERSILALVLVVASIPRAAHGDDCDPVTAWRDGRPTGSVCRDQAPGRGLVVIDLRDDWTPSILAPAADGTGPSYRATYLALAEERFADAGLDAELAARDRYLDLYGVAPTFTVVHARLGEQARHRCHATVDDDPLAATPQRLVEESTAEATARLATARELRRALDHERARRRLSDLGALAEIGTYYRSAVALLAAMEDRAAAIRALQAHLACDGLFAYPPIDGAYTWHTRDAVERFQRGELILPTGIVDAATLEALALDSRERAVRAALRVLRERVVAATGLIEDGTAGGSPGTVLGRTLDPEATWRVRGHAPHPDAAPDLISPATDAAARALGWRDETSIRVFFDALVAMPPSARVVAIPLPPLPAYHAAMQLSVEIDRGDVYRDRTPRWREVERRPALTVFATAGDRRIALVRWPTTIGGWQKQRVDGEIAQRWKESPVGPRIWRDLYVGPSWLPPESTPDRELVRRSGDRYVLAREALGPSYRAAYGMVAFMHLVEETAGDGTVTTRDQGMRTHGTGSLVSLVDGVSHGCHRLLGIHAVRLAGFVLAHRDHVRHGDTPTYYRRIVRYGGSFRVAIDSLGYRIELVPPLPVEVLPGRVHR